MENSAVATGLKKVNAKEYSDYHTTVLISHASRVMFKILQARLQQYVSQETPDVQKMETVADFIFLGSKITADDDCSHEIKGHSVLRRKAVTNIDSVLKSRDITLPTKVHMVKAMVFPVVMYGCESWYIKEAEC